MCKILDFNISNKRLIEFEWLDWFAKLNLECSDFQRSESELTLKNYFANL